MAQITAGELEAQTPQTKPAAGPLTSQKETLFSSCERLFEQTLWASRLSVLLAVVASVAVALAMFFVATVDTLIHIWGIRAYIRSPFDPVLHEQMRTETIEHVVESIDGYLLATVMLIFAFGLYELFISRIDIAQRSDRASRILMIHSLDDLKHRLGQVVLLILVVKFFEGALAFTIGSIGDILAFSTSVLLISFALYLTQKNAHPEAQNTVGQHPPPAVLGPPLTGEAHER